MGDSGNEKSFFSFCNCYLSLFLSEYFKVLNVAGDRLLVAFHAMTLMILDYSCHWNLRFTFMYYGNDLNQFVSFSRFFFLSRRFNVTGDRLFVAVQAMTLTILLHTTVTGHFGFFTIME